MSANAIQKYHSELEKIIDYGGSKKETAIRNSFYNLLNDYAAQKGLMLIAELSIKTSTGRTVTPDGTLKDSLRLDWGYWESKDEADDINLEIERKFDKGYPRDNILFEDSQTGVLYQNGIEVARIDMKNPLQLDAMLKAFINFERQEVVNFRKAIELFKSDIPNVVTALRNLINEQTGFGGQDLDSPKPQPLNPNPLNKEFITKLVEFHETCKQSINPEISLDDINEMMIQHILTADIFNTIFDEPYFHRENNIAEQLETVINTFFTRQIRESLLSKINIYYQAINAAAAGIADHHEKQKFLKIVYENFYKSYNPKAADRLGVVYTPNEIVRFMIESTDYLLHKHFGRFLADKNVEILDPATGTGTFICDMIDYLPKDKLEYKYKNEIHANEVAILPYYIANLNIEFTYKQRMEKYEEFTNLCFVDTLDNMGFDYAHKQSEMFGLSAENTERIKRQNERKISVIIGNPPYNANQMNENDNNKNREYPIIDKRIKDTYIKHSTAQKTKVYDMYSRFYRWAMDRLGDEGIIAFITNRSFINSRTFDGFRKIAASEFDHIYIVDLGGDVRANPKLSGPKHNVFAIQTGVAIMFMVKTSENTINLQDDEIDEFNYLKKTLKLSEIVSEPMVHFGGIKYISPKGCRIFYIRRPEMESAEDKLIYLSETKIHNLIRNGTFEHIRPDKNNNWIELTDNDWDTMIHLRNIEPSKNQIFDFNTNGVATSRDEWVYDENDNSLNIKINYFINHYNKKVNNNEFEIDNLVKWSSTLIQNLNSRVFINYDNQLIISSMYRPFFKRRFYSEKILNDRLTMNHFNIFGNKFQNENKILIIAAYDRKPFSILASNILSNMNFYGDPTQCLPLYRYDSDGKRIDNITDWGLSVFRERYETETLNPEPNTLNPISKEDIFHYVYAVLHNPAYRKKYEMNLKREFPRVPFYDDFWKWAEWGKRLMDLHINFETVEEYPLKISGIEDKEKENDNSQTPNPTPNTLLNKPKLKADKAKGTIELDNITTLSGVPKEAWEYKLGNRSALEWILDQYKEKKPKDPTIAEKFNTYRFADYKDKVIDLLMRVTTVSVETVKIVREMEG
jgi:predicted helicase